MLTKPYVTNFKLLVEAYNSCSQDWISFDDFKSYLEDSKIDYSCLQTSKRSDEEKASNKTLLSRFFHYWIAQFEQRKLVVTRDLVSGGGSQISTEHFRVGKFGCWLYNRTDKKKHIVLFLINQIINIKRFILKHKWLVGAYAAVTTVANAAGHLLDTVAYIVVLLVSLVITAIVFSIYKRITDDIE